MLKLFISSKRSKKNMATASFKAFKCSECSAKYAVSDFDTPYCPECGCAESVTLLRSPNMAKLIKAKGDEVSCVQCPTCKNHIMMESTVAEQRANANDVGDIYCPGCGTDVAYSLVPPIGSLELQPTYKSPSQNVPTSVVTLDKVIPGPYRFENQADRLIAYKDIVPVGEADASDYPLNYVEALNQQALETDDFTLPDDFTLFTIGVPVSEIVSEALKDKQVAINKKYEQNIEALGDRYKQSLAIILTGMPYGLFPDCLNLFDIIQNALTSNGVDPEVCQSVIDYVSNNSNELASVIHDKAVELVTKSDEARNELAETASALSMKKTTAKHELTAMLRAPMKPVETASVPSSYNQVKKGIVASLASQSHLFNK